MIFSQPRTVVLQIALLFFVLASLVLTVVLIIVARDSAGDSKNMVGRSNDVVATELLEDNKIRFPELLLGDQSFFLQPVSYLVRVRESGESLDNVIGTISNVALPYVDWTKDPIWFYKTTSDKVLGIRHLPDTFIGGEEYLLVKTDGTSSVRISGSYLDDALGVDFEYLSVNQVPEMKYEISTNLVDTACAEMPEEVWSNPALESINDWLNKCNENYPLYISEIRVNDAFALSIPRERVYRVQGVFDGQVSYKIDLPETTEKTVELSFLGASEDLDMVYFSLSGQTYALDRNGKVVATDRPSELVNVTIEHYQ